MPLYDIEVVHTLRYKRRVRAKSLEEAKQKADELWMSYMTVGVNYIDEEWEDVSVFPVKYVPPKKQPKNKTP